MCVTFVHNVLPVLDIPLTYTDKTILLHEAQFLKDQVIGCLQQVLSEAISMFLITPSYFPHSQLSKAIVSLSVKCECWDYFRIDFI